MMTFKLCILAMLPLPWSRLFNIIFCGKNKEDDCVLLSLILAKCVLLLAVALGTFVFLGGREKLEEGFSASFINM